VPDLLRVALILLDTCPGGGAERPRVGIYFAIGLEKHLMFSWSLDFLNPDFDQLNSHISAVIVLSGVMACIISATTGLMSYRTALQKQSNVLFWLGNFAWTYALWNILFLSSYARRDIPFASTTLTVEFARRAHLVVGALLPFVCAKFFSLFFNQKKLLRRLGFFCTLAALLLVLIPLDPNYGLVLILSGMFIFGCFLTIASRLYALYIRTDDLKLKTRSFFVLVGVFVCTLFSALGQIRAENLINTLPLPYLGNIFSAVLIYFTYQMVLNPRLREVRELMLRGIRVILLAILLSMIFISLLYWVGENNAELFIFNTFFASFFILSILEPLRRKMDSFFLKHFIVDRYEFEELLKRLPRKLRSSRSLEELAIGLVNGIRESGRIYQTALYLWDATNREYRLIPPSNLTFKNALPLDHPFIEHFHKSRSSLLLEQDQDFPSNVGEALRDLHSHLVLPFFKQDELLGLWALRSSFRSTNPYTSFSNEEVDLLEHVSLEVVVILEQLQHFEAQERKDRLAALGEMSAALAHEIRNPLGAIQGASQLLRSSPTVKDSEDQECIRILQKELDRMQRTVDQYLNFARKTEEPVTISLPKLLEGVIQDVKTKAQKTKTQIHLETESSIPEMKTDPLKVEQVLFNLIQNACEAFSKNVWIKIFRKETVVDQIWVEVKDDGPGIPAKYLSTIFTPLFTTKKAGSGLGLPICKKIIDSLGGELSVESTVGEGTIFRVALPLEIGKIMPTASSAN